MSHELSVITHVYDFILWLSGPLQKLPRDKRHTLGTRLESKLYDLLDLLLEAKFTRDKAAILRQAWLLTEQLRFLLRLLKDLHLMAVNSHQFASEKLHEISREINGWRRHTGNAET